MVWVLATLYVLDGALDALYPNFSEVPLEPLVLVAFALVHGVSRYGWQRLAVLFGAVFGVSVVLENLSVLSGFPFGFYHYTAALGPKLFFVPLLVSLSYLGFGYVSWVLGTHLVSDIGQSLGSWATLLVPAVAAFTMVAWDVCFEPTLSTVRHWWVWEHGGGYFGVPLSNFLGWFLTAFVFFALFALYLRLIGTQLEGGLGFSRRYQLAPVLIYAGTTVGLAMQYLFGSDVLVTDGAGQIWRTSSIYEAAVVVSVFTIFFVGILAAVRVFQSGDKKE